MSESAVYRRQNLTSKVDPRAEKVIGHDGQVKNMPIPVCETQSIYLKQL